ncbi:MAG TPA: hypothetical protein PLR25_20960, partial [Planctomycetaceae bacterium]|nr:hypothetical protein [Planctomycetaceae bacterium]
MFNSLQNNVFDAERSAASELIATGSPLRLNGVGLFFIVAVIGILIRVYWVQTRLPEEYLATLQVTATEDELIPARDGRILTDSIVLASDVDVYGVEVHYRWLQDSVDPQWLKLQVRQRLSREERRNRELVAQTEDQIRAERESLHNALANVTGLSQPELVARFSGIEDRVRRISDSVNRRRTETAVVDEDPDEDDDSGLLISIAQSVRTALTTPPTR